MGGQSTSQGAILGGRKESVTGSYDLLSWQGLTEVLKLGKETLSDPQVYGEFRNLVLAYAKQGGGEELREKINSLIIECEKRKVALNSIAPQENVSAEEHVSTNEVPKQHSYALGGRRMMPRFTPQNRFVSAHGEVATVSSAGQTPDALKPPVIETTPSASVDTPIEQKNIEVEQTATIRDTQPAESIPQIKTLEEHKLRIAEIKRIINERIGNPATLIDTHNEAGKKYMVALLSALKATGGAGTQGVDSVMLELEHAFSELTQKETSGASEAKMAVETPTPQSEKQSVIDQLSSTEIKPLSLKEEVTLDTLAKSFPLAEPTDSQKKILNDVTSKPDFEPSIFATKEPSGDFVDQKISSGKENTENTTLPEEVVLNKSKFTFENSEETPVAPSNSKSAPSETVTQAQDSGVIADDVVLKPHTDLAHSVGVDIKHVEQRQSELFTTEITAALHDLLHEWKVFSSSGLFGTGPGGPEHPLYIKLAPLSMGEIIAGRWEGTNPKSQKGIKEYIDAWRHEQGVAYVVNETFEHYLRRVVQRILKRQNGSVM